MAIAAINPPTPYCRRWPINVLRLPTTEGLKIRIKNIPDRIIKDDKGLQD